MLACTSLHWLIWMFLLSVQESIYFCLRLLLYVLSSPHSLRASFVSLLLKCEVFAPYLVIQDCIDFDILVCNLP